MKRYQWLAQFLLSTFPVVVILTSGCGGDSATDAVAPPATEGPSEIVTRYLEAVRNGDGETVSELLTSAARQKSEEKNISVAPPGSDTATYAVGDISLVGDAKDAAHVESNWTELDETGQPQTIAITWILRNEPAGWRVAGMMGQFLEGQPVMVFNFEQPEEVIKQQDFAREELARRHAEQRQATQPPGDNTLQR